VAPLTLADISDLRAYERERESFRAEVIALKRVRRVPIGPIVTVVFENRTTVRFQVQEMARAEAMRTDEQIEAELAVYNPLVPGPGEVTATLFVELRSDEELRHWLPAPVGIKRSVLLRVGAPDEPFEARATVDPAHAAQLTREETTASVHYLHFELPDAARARFAGGPVAIVVDHPQYAHETVLGDATRASIVGDWAD
jgi:hypothetical protein